MFERSPRMPVPAWVPVAAQLYLAHVEGGQSLRALARASGRSASTVLRQVRRLECRRDDPLVDEALSSLGRLALGSARCPPPEDPVPMTLPLRSDPPPTDAATIAREGRRILRRLCEPGAQLAIAPDMEKAAVLREAADGTTQRTAVVDRRVAQAFALKEWILCRRPGRVASYAITAAGRAALRQMIETEAAARPGLAEAASPFADQHRLWAERIIEDAEDGEPRPARVNLAESPVQVLGRRREKDGRPFLAPELVAAAERLREDFELAQMGPRVAQNWERFLVGGERGGPGGRGPAEGPRAARERVALALRDLGPGLGDIALRVLCFLEGLEATEQRMGWSARSGKIVLRIALTRLRRHYEETGRISPPIG
ncbi:MAG: helix-turn-helix domain-containing protein [Rhodobacteraceae bacterium]|nr:helix-turn-helix domain-containing protein [Paracoccaceae bacterium]